MFDAFKSKVEIRIGDDKYFVSPKVRDYIEDLQSELISSESKIRDKDLLISRLKDRLKEIENIVEDKDLKPALSQDCSTCKYVVKSEWTGRAIKCRKDNVCDDYVKED